MKKDHVRLHGFCFRDRHAGGLLLQDRSTGLTGVVDYRGGGWVVSPRPSSPRISSRRTLLKNFDRLRFFENRRSKRLEKVWVPSFSSKNSRKD